jgi:hypothetical protein
MQPVKSRTLPCSWRLGASIFLLLPVFLGFYPFTFFSLGCLVLRQEAPALVRCQPLDGGGRGPDQTDMRIYGDWQKREACWKSSGRGFSRVSIHPANFARFLCLAMAFLAHCGWIMQETCSLATFLTTAAQFPE